MMTVKTLTLALVLLVLSVITGLLAARPAAADALLSKTTCVVGH